MIHQYKLNGYNIVLDVYSGSVHAVDELAYDAIALVDAGHPRAEAADLLAKKYADHPEVTAEDINDCFDDIEELKADGKLFAEDIYADHAFDFKNRSTVVKALCLHVAHTCNLNCEYCFAAQGKFHGQSGLMSFETGKRALDFLVEHSGTRHNLEVDFFGGEPLMNFEVCKQLVAYARSIEKEKGKNFRFTLTTNGIGITDEVIEWANKECYNVVLSLDGRKEINDRFRKDIAGRGSYDRIVPKFQQLVKARGGKGYYMRGTFTHYNTDFTNDLFHMADDLGFDELSMEPVVSKAGSPEALTEADLPILFDQYELLANDMLRRQKAGKNFSILAVAEGALSTEESKMKRKEWTAKRAEAGYTTATNRIAAAVQKKTGMETRVCIPGHMQRGGSPSAYDRVLATQFGSYAAKLVEIEQYGVTVALVNNHVISNRLEDIAGKTRNIPEGCELLTVAKRMGISLG